MLTFAVSVCHKRKPAIQQHPVFPDQQFCLNNNFSRIMTSLYYESSVITNEVDNIRSNLSPRHQLISIIIDITHMLYPGSAHTLNQSLYRYFASAAISAFVSAIEIRLAGAIISLPGGGHLSINLRAQV